MPWCPKCQKRYQEMGVCHKCGRALVIAAPTMPWFDQIALMAAVSIGLTFAGMGIAGAAKCAAALFLTVWPSIIAASIVVVVLFLALVYRIGCGLEGRLTIKPTVLGWLIGSGFLALFPVMVMLLTRPVDAWALATYLISQIVVPGTGATATLLGAKLGLAGSRGFTVPFVLLTLVGAAALCCWLSLPQPDWMD